MKRKEAIRILKDKRKNLAAPRVVKFHTGRLNPALFKAKRFDWYVPYSLAVKLINKVGKK
jgi:hypothetical protein